MEEIPSEEQINELFYPRDVRQYGRERVKSDFRREKESVTVHVRSLTLTGDILHSAG